MPPARAVSWCSILIGSGVVPDNTGTDWRSFWDTIFSVAVKRVPDSVYLAARIVGCWCGHYAALACCGQWPSWRHMVATVSLPLLGV